ncbi:MAG: hypothetical protein IJC71_08260, partial [Clostridia bacterium]|nr:hypothetical protein [Clostridia bacterium]
MKKYLPEPLLKTFRLAQVLSADIPCGSYGFVFGGIFLFSYGLRGEISVWEERLLPDVQGASNGSDPMHSKG